jgi:hypothetical protein
MTIVDANSSSSVSFPIDAFELFHERISGVSKPAVRDRNGRAASRRRPVGWERVGLRSLQCQPWDAAGCRRACVRAGVLPRVLGVPVEGYTPLVSRGIRSRPGPLARSPCGLVPAVRKPSVPVCKPAASTQEYRRGPCGRPRRRGGPQGNYKSCKSAGGVMRSADAVYGCVIRDVLDSVMPPASARPNPSTPSTRFARWPRRRTVRTLGRGG